MQPLQTNFVCRGCMNPVTGIGCTSVNTDVNANLELVDTFCYLRRMLSVDGDADTAVKNRIRTGCTSAGRDEKETRNIMT